MTKERIILGIDPGYARVGWGVIRVGEGSCVCVDFGCFETNKEEEIGQRLAMINAEMQKIINRFKPTDIAVEELFWGRFVTTGIKISMARGVIFLRAVEHTGRVYEYKPNKVKFTVTGETKADKKLMQSKVMELLGLVETPKPDDCADALAVAITHAALSRENG